MSCDTQFAYLDIFYLDIFSRLKRLHGVGSCFLRRRIVASRPRPPVPSRSSDPALARLWHDLHGSRGEGGEEGPLCVDEGDVAAGEGRPLELRERGGEGQIDLVLLLLADRTRHRRGAVVHESLRARLGFDRSSAWN